MAFSKTSNTTRDIVKESNTDLLENQIFNILNEPRGMLEIQESLNIPLQTFTKAVNKLVKAIRFVGLVIMLSIRFNAKYDPLILLRITHVMSD